MIYKISYKAEFNDLFGHTIKSKGSFFTEFAPYDSPDFPLMVVSNCCPNILGYENSVCDIRVFNENKKSVAILHFVNTMDIMRSNSHLCPFWLEYKDISTTSTFDSDIGVFKTWIQEHIKGA